MAKRTIEWIVVGMLITTASTSQAADGLSTAIKPLLDCRKIENRDARLACFDREASGMASAIDRQDVVVADRQQITKARRSLFGLTSPGTDIFNKDRGPNDSKSEQGVNLIDATIARASPDPYGHWQFVLDDGSRWSQIDELQIPRDPKSGMPIHIRRAAMGSFLANVDKQIAVRVRRTK